MPHYLKGFFRACCIDLLSAYNDAWDDPSVTNHEEAIRHAVRQPAPRFWISPEEAARQISRIEKGKTVQIRKGSNKYKALMALYPVYKRLREHRFPTESMPFVTAYACLEPAPRFYISVDRARRIIDRMRNGEYIV